MKKTDVTQPVAMATPFAEGVYSATSTDDFEIPAATSTTADDSCVMDDGFLPITSTALDDGGKAPERKNFNGMFYLSTDQRFFLQNGGFITYNPAVATAIGGYPQDAILDFIDSNGNYKKVRSLIDDNSNNFVADETLIDGTNWEEISMGGGASRYIGEIVASTIPLEDAELHILDGALLQYGSYQAFIDYMAGLVTDYPSLFTTEALWQSEVASTGFCDKYVYDSTDNSLRLPKYGSQLLHNLPSTLGVKGNGKGIGLLSDENLGLVSSYSTSYRFTYATTGSYGQNVGEDAETGNATLGKVVGVTTDASSSGIIADTSTINKASVYYYVVIATTTKTPVQVDIDEVMTDLNGKADIDLSNVPNSKGILVESYRNGSDWYRVYSDGWCEQGGFVANTPTGRTYTLLKAYPNTDYTVFMQASGPNYGTSTNIGAVNKTSGSSFIHYHYNSTTQSWNWRACGYIN